LLSHTITHHVHKLFQIGFVKYRTSQFYNEAFKQATKQESSSLMRSGGFYDSKRAQRISAFLKQDGSENVKQHGLTHTHSFWPTWNQRRFSCLQFRASRIHQTRDARIRYVCPMQAPKFWGRVSSSICIRYTSIEEIRSFQTNKQQEQLTRLIPDLGAQGGKASEVRQSLKFADRPCSAVCSIHFQAMAYLVFFSLMQIGYSQSLIHQNSILAHCSHQPPQPRSKVIHRLVVRAL